MEVEIDTDDLERLVTSAAGEIGREMKVAGFREGKVPAQVVLQQVGRETVVDQAVRRALPDWYEEAVHQAGLATVGSPDVNVPDLPEKGASLAFSFEVGVRPTAVLGEYKGVEAGRRDVEVPEDEAQAELDRMRESLASLDTVDRPAAEEEYVVIDFTGSIEGEAFEGGEARGYLLELGSGRLIPGFEEQLIGASAGDEREVEVTFPENYPNGALAGKAASFAVEVKEVKEKRLPALDDDLAVEAGGYESLDELREEISTRLRTEQEAAIDLDYREAVVDAVAGQARVEVPDELRHAKATEMWRMTATRIRNQGLDLEQYLQMTGKTEEEIITEAEPEAERALRREATLAAVIEAEGIEVSDNEMMDALREAAAQPGTPGATDQALRRSLKKAREQGTDTPLREDIAMRKAVDLLVEHAKPVAVPAEPDVPDVPDVPDEPDEPDDELWMPEAEAGSEPDKKLWTPGSD